MTDNRRRVEVLLWMQGALLGEVSPALRSVHVKWDDTSVHFEAFFDGPISEVDEESMSCVETELIANRPEQSVSYTVTRVDFPERVPSRDICVYARREAWSE